MENRYTYNRLKEFFFDEELCNWIRKRPGSELFDLSHYKASYPGYEEEIDVVVEILSQLQKSNNDDHFSAFQIATSMIEMRAKVKKEMRRKIGKRIVAWSAAAAAIIMPILFFIIQQSGNDLDSLYAHFSNQKTEFSDDIYIIRNNAEPIVVADKSEITIKENGSIWVADQCYTNKQIGNKVSENQIVVPRGKRSSLILPDGSHLSINSGSKVLYCSDFNKKRHLFVDGEIYLDVVKDPQRPFKVKTSRFEVEVLGTSFNVKDYERDFLSSIVLVEGSVKVKMKTDHEISRTLKPNEKLDLMGSGIKIKETDVYNSICWKDDVINFNGKPLSYILSALAEYYDTPIEGIEEVQGLRCKGNLDLNKSLEEVLQCISMTTPIRFNKENGYIIVKRVTK